MIKVNGNIYEASMTYLTGSIRAKIITTKTASEITQELQGADKVEILDDSGTTRAIYIVRDFCGVEVASNNAIVAIFATTPLTPSKAEEAIASIGDIQERVEDVDAKVKKTDKKVTSQGKSINQHTSNISALTTESERHQANIDYIAMMTDVEIPTEE